MGTYNVHAGHCPQGKGAYGAVGILQESVEDRKVKDEVIRLLRAEGHTVYDCTCEENTTQDGCLSKIVAKCNAHKVDLDVSIHLNSGRNDYKGDNSTGGTEVYNYDTKTKNISDRICANISASLGIRNRGTKYDKGLYVLKNTKSTALLVECCFVDDKDDANRWNVSKCAKAIVEGILGKTVSGGAPANKPSEPSKPAPSAGYYPAFNNSSIVDGLKGIGVDSSMANRKKIAAANGIANYEGTAAQNSQLCNLAKQGKLKKAGSGGSAPAVSYYKAFNNSSIVDGLKSIGVDSSFANRKKIAAANGIVNYEGTGAQNSQLCSLAKQGKLKKA